MYDYVLLNEEHVSNQALMMVGTITAVVVAIFAGNWQAELLAQQIGGLCGNGICEQGEDSVKCKEDCKIDIRECEPYDCIDATGKRPPRCSEDGYVINYLVDPCRPVCPSILCSAPPLGCEYVSPYKTNDQGCQANCGEIACDDDCVTVDCAAPPPGCKYINSEYDGECMASCGKLICESQPPEDRCSTMRCSNGCRDGQCIKPAPPRVCEYGWEIYQAGDTFKAKDGCNKCYCNQDGSVECTEMACAVDDDDAMAEERFRYVQFGCRDGLTLNEGSPTSCKSRKEWNDFVVETCRDRCDDEWCGETAMNVYEFCSGGDSGSDAFCLSGGQRYYPGESFIADDGCNKCFCSENATSACTKMACIDPPQPSYPNPNDPTDPDQGCFSSQDCGPGTICSVELGECNSGPCGPDGNCASVCTGSCVQKGSDDERRPDPGYEDEVRTAPIESHFSDAQPTSLEGEAANTLAGEDIIGGFADGTFRGGQSVNRAEAAKFLMKARFGSIGDERNNGRFLDVREGEWYVRYVIAAAKHGIISGYADGTFRPANTVNTAEFLKMLSIAFDLPQDLHHEYTDVPAGAWFEQYAGVAELYDLFPGRPTGQLQPEKLLTRGEVAIAIYKLLEE
jgi:hypothetical protein